MAVSITYVGPAGSYHFDKADFSRHDVDDQGAVTFNDNNKKTADVSDAAWTLLKELGFGDVFKETSELTKKEEKAVSEEDDADNPPAAVVAGSENTAGATTPDAGAAAGGTPAEPTGAAKASGTTRKAGS